VKRQFVIPSLADSQQSDQHTQEPTSGSWLSEQQQGELAPPPTNRAATLVAQSKKGGLLSSGKYTYHGETELQTPPNLRTPQRGLNVLDGPTAAFQQPAGKADAVPMTGPLLPHMQGQAQGYSATVQPELLMNGPVSPHQSGISPLASLYAELPTQQAPVMPPYAGVAQPVGAPLGTPWQAMSPAAMRPVPPMMAQPMGFAAAPPLPPVRTTRKKKKFPIWARVALALFIVMLVITGSGIAYYEVNFASHINNIVGQRDATLKIVGKDGSVQSSDTTANIGTNRINILLLGSDTDGKNSAPLAQTDIVVTIDPMTKYVGMLSIPRDLWINVPGFGMHKLDEAFGLGWQYQNPADPNATPFENAAAVSKLTIEQDFGIPINYYAWVGLNGFIKVIDTAGGIDINALHPMLDDVYPNDINSPDAYAYKRLYIVPGPQHMDGIQALEYVRTRHSDLVGDFGRSERQQQVLSQLKTKLDTPGIVNELPALAQDMDGYVKTDMTLSDLVNLVTYARGLDPNKVDHLVLSPPYSTSFTAPNGEAAFQPICSQIQPAIAKMFGLGSNALCNVTATSGNGATLARAGTGTQPVATTQAAALTNGINDHSDPLASLEPGQSINALSLANGSSEETSIHSILDLMFMVTFESLDASQA
jgi:LCP family protein required for cell wall assembly